MERAICPCCGVDRDARLFICGTCASEEYELHRKEAREATRRLLELRSVVKSTLAGAVVDDALFTKGLVHLAELVGFNLDDVGATAEQRASFLRLVVGYRQRIN